MPLIWSDPSGEQPDTTAIQGSAIDFAPTVLQRSGLKVPVGMQGQDLLADDAVNLPVLIEDSGLAFAGRGTPTARRTLVHEGWRMTVFEGFDGDELYDLGRDPHELENLWSDLSAQDTKVRMIHAAFDRQIALRDVSLIQTHQA